MLGSSLEANREIAISFATNLLGFIWSRALLDRRLSLQRISYSQGFYHLPESMVPYLYGSSNSRAINHDPVRHPDPDVFLPERYINDHMNAAESAALPDVTKRGTCPL